MALNHPPKTGTIVICDFQGLTEPEMVKRRPVVVVSPRLRKREGLVTVVPLSTTPPDAVEAYHHTLRLSTPLPKPYVSTEMWVKGDMLYTVSLARLNFPFKGKDASGCRIYDIRVLDHAELLKIRICMLHALGMPHLTAHL